MVDFLKSDDGRLALVQSGAGVDGLQLVVRLDGAVFVGGHGPRHVHVVGMRPGWMGTVAVAADTGTAVQSAPRWCQPSLRTPPQHATTPFDAVNYVGSCSVEPSSDVTGMAAIFDRVIRVLYRRLDT